jgi:predicted nucleotidyltransferase
MRDDGKACWRVAPEHPDADGGSAVTRIDAQAPGSPVRLSGFPVRRYFGFWLVTHRNRWQYRTMINQGLQNEIVARLSAKKPLKVILFGSRAGDEFDEGSDVDLVVVLDKEGIPRTFKEKTDNFLEVNRLLRDLNKRVAMDLVVMTRTQWERFVEMDSGFSREVQEKGRSLI